MKFTTLIVAVAVALAPTLAISQSCDHGEKTASSCIEGYVWDNNAQNCVAIVSG